jgi:putative membrane protein
MKKVIGLMILAGLVSFGFVLQAKDDSSKFAAKAAQGGMAEVEMGRLAAQQGSDPAVKTFGQRMADDHSKANDELKSMATKNNLALPSAMSAMQKAEMDKLSKLSGAAFDKAYMSLMVKDHEKDVKEFEMQSKNGTNPDIKDFASTTLPTLQSHLQMARDTAAKVGAK